MKEQLTAEQNSAINAKGKIIVSASAGSGKTFVMIQKLADLIESGGDLDSILAVTFTKKAAAQMKEKLRKELIARLATPDEDKKANIKDQLNKIQSADISTIHSFCSHLVRTHFYALDIDSSFDIIADDDAQAMLLKNRAMDSLFDEMYEEDNDNFKLLLATLRKKRSDDNIRYTLLEAYKNVRMTANYEQKLASSDELYSEQGFEKICREYKNFANDQLKTLIAAVDKFEDSFEVTKGGDKYTAIFNEMRSALNAEIAQEDIFAPLPKLYVTPKPRATEEDSEASCEFTDFKDNLKKRYEGLFCDLADRQTELDRFMNSAPLVIAFCNLLLAFDREYTAVKKDEGKLDYNDLEHLTLKLLQDEEIKSRINEKYKYVFVDEYQDVNPVQEAILDQTGCGDVFTVGDVKQAIYGFRGSKSLFFAQKYHRMLNGEGSALKLSNNFRSSDGVINFVNDLFSRTMRTSVCGFDYKDDSIMLRGGGYSQGYGRAEVHVFGKDDQEKKQADGIYSVVDYAESRSGHTKEGLAVLEIVKRELSSQRYDLTEGKMVDVQAGDICILTRKRAGTSVTGIVRALTDAGYSVAGAKEANICERAEVKQMLDILSYIDNCQQDIPLVSALLSSLGGLSEEELALIKIAKCGERGERPPFRECAIKYATEEGDPLAHKLANFFKKIYAYRKLSELLGAAKLIDKILIDSGLCAKYSSDGGEKLAGIRRLAEEAYTATGELSLNAFLAKIKAGGYKINAPVPTSSDSIKVMTMHASKGLEFPIVIIADAAASFKGRDISDMPYDEEYGFAPKYYDVQNKLQYKTLLARLIKLRLTTDEIKNELNLFYVACTRAMCNLHIMVEELCPCEPAGILSATSYAQICDFSRYTPEYMPSIEDFAQTAAEQILISSPDQARYAKLKRHFMPTYPHAQSVDLPVKSSASQLLQSIEEPYYAENNLFAEDEGERSYGGTGAERGTAYHRFLQLCDFEKNSRAQVSKQLESFVASGQMTEEQAGLLSADNLTDILAMPTFKKLKGAQLYREREFLCILPANKFLDTPADDGVLVQGAIDLLAITKEGTAIIDYKYSKKSDEQLLQRYGAQLRLYRSAVARILNVGEQTISMTIVNIYAKTQIDL